MLRTIILTIVLGIVFFLIDKSGYTILHSRKWELLTFFLSMAYLNHLLMQLGMKNNREKFVQFFMASTAIRFIVSVLLIGYFVFCREKGIYIFISNFFVLYLLYTGFEIWSLYRNLRSFS